MSNLRLPTMRQLEKMGPLDAGAVLDYQEQELNKVLVNLSPSSAHYSNDRRRVRAALRRVQKRREEFFKA